MADCCCEIKEKLCAEGVATRGLINDLNVHKLESQLADAKLQASQNAQTLEIERQFRRFGHGHGGHGNSGNSGHGND